MLEIKELTQINSVSGNEGAIRKKLLEMITPFADNIEIDTMGNLIAFKKGISSGGKKVILSSHMDEVGFIVSDITEEGYLSFKSVGGIDPRIMLCQKVLIEDGNVRGVLGVKAVHLQTPEERKNIIKEKDMYIDIGAKSCEEAEEFVKKGDYIAFDSPYREFGDGVIKAKAIDDRAGCAILAELIKESYDNDIYFCFSVQEEVGVRGATVIARKLKADVAITIEATTASDVAGAKPNEYATEFGKGPVLSVMDKGSYSDRELNRFIVGLCEDKKLLYQFKKSSFGGNDARAYQTSSLPCKTAVISIPSRYIHSPVSCAKKSDIEGTYRLAKAICENIHKF